MDPKILAEVLSAFIPDSPNHHQLRDLDPKDEFTQKGAIFEQAFTAAVDTLRRFQNAPIRNLMSYVWGHAAILIWSCQTEPSSRLM